MGKQWGRVFDLRCPVTSGGCKACCRSMGHPSESDPRSFAKPGPRFAPPEPSGTAKDGGTAFSIQPIRGRRANRSSKAPSGKEIGERQPPIRGRRENRRSKTWPHSGKAWLRQYRPKPKRPARVLDRGVMGPANPASSLQRNVLPGIALVPKTGPRNDVPGRLRSRLTIGG